MPNHAPTDPAAGSGHDPIRRHDRGRVAVLELDSPGRSMNVVDEAALASLRRHVDAVVADPDVDAVVLTSGKPGTFGAGADVAWLPQLAAREDAESFLEDVHDLMGTLLRSPKPMVTAVDGPAFGGALELALGGSEILATPGSVLGLPEVTLSLLPGGGGTQLLARFLPTAEAVEALTSGARLDATTAADRGLVRAVVPAEQLLDQAVAVALETAAGTPRPAEPVHGADAAAVVEAHRQALAGSRRGLSAAAAAILDAVAAGVAGGLQAGLAAERRGFLSLLRSPESRAALHLFAAEGDVRRRSRGGEHPDVANLGVVGGGQMGAGIAATALSRGLAALVRDVDEASLVRARDHRDRVLARTAPQDGADERVGAWSDTTTWEGFARADAIIEAVFELPELKTDVLRDLCEVAGPDVLLATNTSAIPIATLARAVDRPERFLGMHFFSPVDRMPLVELIPHEGTAAAVVQRAAGLGRQLGKVPVVVGDAPGFFTSRVYARWLAEGVRLLLDGVPVEAVDAAATAAGFPVGPLQAHDEATLNLVVQASITQVAEPVMADRLDVAAVRAALESLIGAGVEGRRQGAGFYAYDADGQRSGANPVVTEVLGTTPADVPRGRVGERLLLAFATECWSCWDDGTLCHPDDGDVAAVLGIGFPRVLGGPFRWADEVGHSEVRERCAAAESDAGSPGSFPAGTTAARLADRGGTFHDEPRRPAPFQPPAA